MPNHITNVIEFDCSVERFKEIAKSLRSNPEEPLGQVDFNKLIPMPESLAIEAGSRGEAGYKAYKEFVVQSMPLDDASREHLEETFKARFKDDPETWELGKQYFQNIMQYGCPNWYDWCCEHWNTKWNAYDCARIEPSDKRLEFSTAWSSVPPIIEAISKKYPDVTMNYSWADEDIGYNVGRITIRNGEVLDENIPEGGTRAAYEMAADIRGDDLEDWGLTLSEDGSTYEWHDMDSFSEPENDHPSRSGEAR